METSFNNAIFDKLASSSSPQKSSRRSIQKRVVSVPINLESYSNTPPYDSWAWRKYGQKPIKGSPYPRGYYRCSSSKACPATKQVEKSHIDPTMLVVTYSCEHNHPIPASRNHHSGAGTKPGYQKDRLDPEPEPEANSEEKITDLVGEAMVVQDEFSWFSVMETATSTVLEGPIFGGKTGGDEASAVPMREEEEALFADLGELPECSVVFRRGKLLISSNEKPFSFKNI